LIFGGGRPREGRDVFHINFNRCHAGKLKSRRFKLKAQMLAGRRLCNYGQAAANKAQAAGSKVLPLAA
jgi:hypothetical protein